MLETPLSKKEKATTKNTKITKEKILISKSKHTVNVENQPHIKLVGRLKDKHNKTIYIHNKYLREKQNKKI